MDNHIIRSHKNPRRGADLASRFKSGVLPEIAKDVTESIKNKQLHGDDVDESVIKRELVSRINTELVKLGVAMIPTSE